MLDPSGNLAKSFPQTPGMKLIEGLKGSALGKAVESSIQTVGKLAKALPGLGDLMGGGGKGNEAGLKKVTEGVPVLQDMFSLLGKTNNMGGGIQSALASLIKS